MAASLRRAAAWPCYWHGRGDGASRRIGQKRIMREPVAFDEHMIDVMDGLPAVAGSTAGTKRRGELRILHFLTPCPPASEALGLVGQILERQLHGIEPAAQALGIDTGLGQRLNRLNRRLLR